jgi:hypothetical protein
MHKIDWNKWDSKQINFRSDRGECRTCGHGEYWHSFQRPACTYNFAVNIKLVYKSDDMGDILIPRDPGTNGLCPCLRYIPGENLAYLEWKENERA